MQEVIFYFDDSGVFHRNANSDYFVYAGYVFTNKEEYKAAKRKYVDANKKIKKALGRTDELKACNIENKHKRALFNSVREFDSLAICVNISNIYDCILDNKKSICRYKDYVLKLGVKKQLTKFISEGTLKKNEDIHISIYIDEQLTATNGYYDLRESIVEELQFGIKNFDYGVVHKNVFNSKVKVDIYYCDSSHNYMVQASDILANRIWHSYKDGNVKLREIDNHINLTFP